MGAHFEALNEGVLLVPLDPRYTQVGFNIISVQVCSSRRSVFCAAKLLFNFGGGLRREILNVLANNHQQIITIFSALAARRATAGLAKRIPSLFEQQEGSRQIASSTLGSEVP